MSNLQTIHFALATVFDLELLVSLRIEFLIHNWGHQTDEKISILQDSLKEQYAQTLQNKDLIAVLAFCDNEIAGIGALSILTKPGTFTNPTGKTGYILNMYTRANYRKMGIARTIFNMLIEEGKKLGISMFELHATDDGIALYKSEGFEKPKLENLVYQI